MFFILGKTQGVVMKERTLILCFFLSFVFLASKSNQVQSSDKFLVRVLNKTYKCNEVIQTPCGYYLSCGKKSFHCAVKILVEKL